MNLGAPPKAYSPEHQKHVQRELEQLDRTTLRQGRDNEVGSGRIILQSANGSRWALHVSNTGVLSTVAV